MKSVQTFCLALSCMVMSHTLVAQTEVTFYTNYGDFVVELYDSLMPITAGNFKSLVEQEFYDGVIFHRVIDNFVIQGGDPTGTGTGGPGYTIPDEFDSTLSNVQMTLSMANSGPNTGGSQFFVNLVDNTFLDFDKTPFTSAHPVFAIVTLGFQVVDSIGDVPVDPSARPIDSVVMDSLRVTGPLPPVSVQEVAPRDFAIDIFPNPIDENSAFAIQTNTQHALRVSVYDQMGVRVVERGARSLGGKTIIAFRDLWTGSASLAPGVYHLVLSDGDRVSSRKFVVLH